MVGCMMVSKEDNVASSLPPTDGLAVTTHRRRPSRRVRPFVWNRVEPCPSRASW